MTTETLYINDSQNYGDRCLVTAKQLDAMDLAFAADNPDYDGNWRYDGAVREFTPDYIRMYIGWQGYTVDEVAAEAIWAECISAGDIAPMNAWEEK